MSVRGGDLQNDEARAARNRPGPLRGMPLRGRGWLVLRASRRTGRIGRRWGIDMTWFSKLAAVTLAALAIVGVIAWVNLLDRYIAASDVRMQFGNNVGYQSVAISAITSVDQDVTIGVQFFFRNPSAIAVDIIHISYRFY